VDGREKPGHAVRQSCDHQIEGRESRNERSRLQPNIHEILRSFAEVAIQPEMVGVFELDRQQRSPWMRSSVVPG